VSDEPRRQNGISVKTLLIAAASSATAALVVPMFWEPGTVFASAMTPIIVSIVSELLKRPTEKVTAVTARRTKGGAVILDPPPRRHEEPFDPLAPAPTEELEALPQTTTPRADHRRPLTGRQWKLAVVTGLIAFGGAATVVTASELLAGDPVSSDRGRTTLFGGAKNAKDDTKPAAKDDASPTPTPTPTGTPTPTPTPTATPTPTQTPTTTPTPAPAAPAPQAVPSASPAPAP
jgi:hypothetical protein